MNDNTKESKFLAVINRYAESQKAQITKEIEDYKNAKIEQATEQGLKDAYELIKSDVAKRKAAILNDTAKCELELRQELFSDRQSIYDRVFEEAKEKLRAFVKTEDYSAFLSRSLKNISEVIKGDVTVYIAPFDEDKKEMIISQLNGAKVEADNRILLGGVKAFDKSLGIMIDETLDAKLEEQRAWFIENSGLKVV